jgi:hypothetical protein
MDGEDVWCTTNNVGMLCNVAGFVSPGLRLTAVGLRVGWCVRLA